MKAPLILAFALLSSPAHAELKAQGTVLSFACATSVSHASAAKVSVCYADVSGQAGSFVTINEEVWQIVERLESETKLSLVGRIGADGLLEYFDTMVFVGATLKHLNGDEVELTTKQGAIKASEFQVVYHPQFLK